MHSDVPQGAAASWRHGYRRRSYEPGMESNPRLARTAGRWPGD